MATNLEFTQEELMNLERWGEFYLEELFNSPNISASRSEILLQKITAALNEEIHRDKTPKTRRIRR